MGLIDTLFIAIMIHYHGISTVLPNLTFHHIASQIIAANIYYLKYSECFSCIKLHLTVMLNWIITTFLVTNNSACLQKLYRFNLMDY